MHTLQVQIERLAPMRVATVAVTSASPEHDAINTLINWARPQGLLDGDYRFFGYDNCQDYPNHCYTAWLTVGNDVMPSGNIEVKQFPGGTFAVTDAFGTDRIAPQWAALARWCQDRGYHIVDQPGLEEHFEILEDRPLHELRFRLYLPITG